MWRAGVRGVVLAGFPYFVKEESARLVGAAVQIVLQAAFFLARGGNERAKLGFEEDVSPFLGAQRNDKRNGTFRELGDRSAVGAPTGGPPRGFAGFLFRHVGGDCTPNSFNGKDNRKSGLGPIGSGPLRWRVDENRGLFLVGVFSASVQAIEVQKCIEHQGIGVLRFAAVDRVDGEQDDVAGAAGHVEHGGVLGDFVAVFDEAGDEQILGVGEAQDHARPVGRRDYARIVEPLIVGWLGSFPEFLLRLFGNFGSGAADYEIGVIFGTATRGARFHLRAQVPATSAKNAGDGEDGAIIPVGGDLFFVTIGN